MKEITYRSIAAAIIFLFAAVASIPAQEVPKTSTGEQAVRKLERAWLDAYEKRDAGAMDTIVAADFTITFPDGSSQTKPQIMDSLKQTGGTTIKFRTEEVRSRFTPPTPSSS